MGCNELLAELEDVMATVKDEVEQAVGGKKVAITRARKALQAVKTAAQDLRKELMELKK